MPLFLLVTQQPPTGATQMLARLETLYPDNRPVADNAWLIRSPQTSKEISDALFPREDKMPVRSHIVVSINGYYGWHDRAIWEWMATKTG